MIVHVINATRVVMRISLYSYSWLFMLFGGLYFKVSGFVFHSEFLLRKGSHSGTSLMSMFSYFLHEIV